MCKTKPFLGYGIFFSISGQYRSPASLGCFGRWNATCMADAMSAGDSWHRCGGSLLALQEVRMGNPFALYEGSRRAIQGHKDYVPQILGYSLRTGSSYGFEEPRIG